MNMNQLSYFAKSVLEISALFLVFSIGVAILVIIYLYIQDVTQTKQAIRRNYPVIGRFRYLFEHLGEFFRQYFFVDLHFINGKTNTTDPKTRLTQACKRH